MSQNKSTANNIGSYRNDIYANLPAHQLHTDANKTTADIIHNNASNQHISRKSMLSKEMLYATPLRKSDRFKSRDKQKSTENDPRIIEKLSNIESRHSTINKDQLHPADIPVVVRSTNGEVNLEERRILSFLKDTTQLHKKMEMHRDFPNSNFSCLAREEHFANLVHQNVVNNDKYDSGRVGYQLGSASGAAAGASGTTVDTNNMLDENSMNLTEADRESNLECLMERKVSPDKEVGDLICLEDESPIVCTTKQQSMLNNVNINREWVLKKVAMCLEQRSTKKPISTPLINESVMKIKELGAVGGGGGAGSAFTKVSIQPQNVSHIGCLIMGSNGSGKTSICRSILTGTTGTKGILNRKLLGCYFVDSQNPDCHNLSMFIRSLILQILSHSSYLTKEDGHPSHEQQQQDQSTDNTRGITDQLKDISLEEEMLITELSQNLDGKLETASTTKIMIRQQSEPIDSRQFDLTRDGGSAVLAKSCEANSLCDLLSNTNESPNRTRTGKVKTSKIPVKIGNKSPKKEVDNNAQTIANEESSINESAENSTTEDQIVAEIEEICENPSNDIEQPITSNEVIESASEQIVDEVENVSLQQPTAPPAEASNKEEMSFEIVPPPLPKSKSCRTATADEYYEMLISNPDILENFYADNIEKNPDDCFKKSILFPLLELTPPKNALLLLIDSIDENYINEGNLISTLRGRSSTKSRNIADLLSNHIHLFPKWLFLVCTAKKQNKYVTKIFSGFKKITLDDLRKSHVVKDVQEYIINRLNTDFKGSINLSKDVIESLNQLYIKSNGCILYLQKVLNGIKENFFSFREIKLIPCTLNGLYLYICQKSFNKKQYTKIRPILNILLACSGFVEALFVLNCLRTHNYAIDNAEFEKRIGYMRNILVFHGNKIKIFHNSFCDWLVDVKFSTRKFLCDVNEGHVMIAMYYTFISDTLCPNQVRRYLYHLIKAGEYLNAKNINLDLILILLESRTNLSDCFYTNLLNCCYVCEDECKNDMNFLPKTRDVIEKFLNNELNEDFSVFLCDFFKPNLPTDVKTLKLLTETGINNVDCQLSFDSSNSPVLTDKSQNIDSELAELLISSERTCQQESQQQQQQQQPLSHHQQSQAGHNANSRDHDAVSPMLEQPTDGTTGTIEGEEKNLFIRQLTECHNLELHKGKAFIHILANEGNHLLLERALKACKDPIDLEIEDISGQTALNIAARNGHIDIVQLLLSLKSTDDNRIRQVDVNHADRDGWTPLRSASWGGHTEVVKLLIEQPNCDIDLADKEERTALRAAAWSGHEDILKILIAAGANVNSVDKQGRTSLIAASYMGHYEIVEILLENGADVNHLDVDGRSALCVAALCGTSGYSKVISCLLEHGANTDQLDNDGMSPLLVSSFEGNSEVCELLLENGADPDLADFMGRTPLWAACTAGHANVVKLLLFWGCSIDCMDSEGRTVLSIAAAQGNLETVRQLLDRGLDETHRDNAGWTPLHYAAFEGYADICTQLVDSGAKIDECDNEGKTALHLSAQEGRDKVIEALLTIHNACVDLRAHDGKSGFRLACIEAGHIDSINTLLKFGCDVNLKDADSRTTLYVLALENKLKIVKYLLEHSNINVNIPDSEGRTALHVAAWQGHLDMVKLLISQGHADVNAMDHDCRTPVHSCAWQGNHEVMEVLLFCGAIPDHACKQGATALGISAQEGHEQCVKFLLEYGANPYKSDHCGRTPIKLAAKSNRNNVLRVLENFTKNDANFEQKHHLGHIQKSPDKPILLMCNQNPNLLMPNTAGSVIGPNNNIHNATNSTQSSNNFYENTMHSDASSLQKRKSVISSQSTGSSNNETPLSFTQQLQRHSRHSSRHSQVVQCSPVNNQKYSKGSQKHAQVLPNVDEYQTNLGSRILSNDADLSDMGCMSPLYATPPHSPSSDISSPGQHPSLPNFEDSSNVAANNTNQTLTNQMKMDHFARDTHMRIILGNAHKESQSGKSKRSGIATNPAVRMIRSRFDAASQLIRRTNNMLSSNSNSQGSSSIGIKSGTFQWRKESQIKSKRSGIATNPAVRMIRSRFDAASQLIRRTNNMLSSNSNSQGSSSIGIKSGTFQWRKESQM